MPNTTRYGLEQARTQLPSLAARANAGVASVITRHGKPYAAIVSIQALEKSLQASSPQSGILELRGTGRGLWGKSPGKTISRLRDEWHKV